MSAVNLYINEEKVSYEIRQNVIVIKEKGNVIFEVPLPDGYHLLGILDEGNNKKNIVITPYELKKPNYIPEGYGNLHLFHEGCWEIDKKSETLFTTRHLHYVDTTLLKPEHYLEVSDGQFQISQEEIPKSFWFSDQHRDLLPDILDDKSVWIQINKIPEYLKGFDPRCRLITEEECMSLFAFNEATDFCFKGYTKLTGIEPQYDSLPKFILGSNEYYIENWDKIVLSRENRGVYKQLLNKLAHPDRIYRNRPIPSFITDELHYANFVIPVIDEEAGKKILVK